MSSSAAASPFSPVVGVMDMQDDQKRSIAALCDSIRRQQQQQQGLNRAEVTRRATLAVTADLLQAHGLYSSRMNAPDYKDNSLAIDEQMMLDVEFLDWFFSRVAKVRVEPGRCERAAAAAAREFLPVDVSCMRSCRQLSVRCVPADLFRGLSALRDGLESLTICHCRNISLRSVLAECLADGIDGDVGAAAGGAPWKCLRRLSLSHNKMRETGGGEDGLFARLSPSLERVDLSFNQLTEVDGLDGLHRLTHLSLGFNRLRALPLLNSEARLVSLHFAHNAVETLSGLETMTSLAELDLSWNVLMHHDALAPLSLLPKLARLNLKGNPITARIDHRMLSSQWLNSGIDGDMFVLDGFGLSAREKAQIGLSRIMPTTPSTAQLSRSSTEVAGGSRTRQGSAPAATSDPMQSSSIVSASVASWKSGGSRGSGSQRKRRRKPIAPRVAEIAEPKDDETIERERQEMLSGPPSGNYAGEDTGHLDTKRQIEELRRKYGEEDWLHSQAAAQVHAVLGMQEDAERNLSEMAAHRVEDSKKVDIDKFLEQAAASVREKLSRGEMRPSARPKDESTTEEDSSMEKVPNKSSSSEKDEQSPRSASGPKASDDAEPMKRKTSADEMTDSFYTLYPSAGGKTVEEEEEVSRARDLCISVRSKSENSQEEEEEFTLRVTGDSIREETARGLVRESWFLHSLADFEMLVRSPMTVQLGFSVTQKERRSRRLVLCGGESDYFKLVNVLQPVLEAHARSALALGTMQCLKCQVKFTKDAAAGKESSDMAACRNCGSTMVIELEREADDEEEDEAAAVGIPACEDMQLEDDDAGAAPSSLKEADFMLRLHESSTPKKPDGRRRKEEEEEGERTPTKTGGEF